MDFVVPRMDERESRAWLGLIGVVERLSTTLDAQLQRDSSLTHFEYMVLAVLRRAPESTLRMTALARTTAASLPRLSHVCSRLERRVLVERFPCPTDRRATNVRLTEQGRRAVVLATPAHIELVRSLVVDALTTDQLEQLADITAAIGERLDAVPAR